MNRKAPILIVLSIFFLCSCRQGPISKARVESDRKGSIHHYPNFQSKQNILPRNIDVWLPEGYSTQVKHQVLYMHDGQNLFNPETSYGGESWEIDVTLQNLQSEGLIEPTLVVGIWNTSDRTLDYTPNKPYLNLADHFKDTFRNNGRIVHDPKSDAYLRFIVTELKPFIDSSYHTYTDKEHTFIAGSSMGGLVSLYAQVEYPEVFGGAACLSTHWPLGLDRNRSVFAASFGAYLRQEIRKDDRYKLYFDYGTEKLDSWYETHQLYVNAILQEVHSGPRMCYKDEGAEHNEKYWRNRFHRIAQFLLSEQ